MSTFSKVSRYRNADIVTALDAKGRTLAATDIRLLPDVTGTFQHTVGSGDRLDQLAYQYYGQPLQWWNICDGNAKFLSPTGLLGQDSIVATQFPVSIAGTPPWNSLLASLLATVGIEDARIATNITLVPQVVMAGVQQITTYIEQASPSVVVVYNNLNVTPSAIANLIEGAGFQVGPYVELGQTGRSIVIPPRPIG